MAVLLNLVKSCYKVLTIDYTHEQFACVIAPRLLRKLCWNMFSS